MPDSRPASTTLPALLDRGSDRPLRELIYALASLGNVMHGNQARFAEALGVSVPQYLVLSILEDAPGATVTAIASRLEVTTQFVTLETGRLLERGLIAKKPNPADGRSMLLDLTARGRTLLRGLAPLRCEANDLMFRSLTREQAKSLAAMVEALVADGREAQHALAAPKATRSREKR